MSGGWTRAEGTPTRKERLPDNWAELRRLVEARAGGRCEAFMKSGKRCHDPGTDCDHVVRGTAGHDNDDLSNLQWLCAWHHRMKTAAEANAAKPVVTARHPREKHPGGLSFY